MDLLRPDVYISDVKSGTQPIEGAATTIGIMLGALRTGPVGEYFMVGSWTEFLEYAANGLDTPYLAGSDLPYAVYGFFANGGQYLYIIRVASANAAAASKAASTNTGLTVTAVDKGNLSPVIKIAKAAAYEADENEEFVVTVTMSSAEDASVTIEGVYKDNIVDLVNSNAYASKWVKATGPITAAKLQEETLTLTGGVDNVAGLTDTDFIDALSVADTIDDASFIAIPGQTSAAIHSKLMEYGDNNQLFPILDAPVGSSVSTVKTYRKGISAFTGALVYPWGYVYDPLTEQNKLVPPSGHYMGVSARQIAERGVGKAPAGTDAVVRGFLEMESVLTKADIAQLNPAGVVSILPMTGSGIVVWGARSLSSDATMKYVSDGNINYYLKKSLYRGTLWAVFEPNNASLWDRVAGSCRSFLHDCRTEGVIRGESDEEAFYVICDSSNNTQSTIDNGILNIQIGYAPQKPAEFVVIKIAHQMSS